jgi:Ca2+-transporting ATPase
MSGEADTLLKSNDQHVVDVNNDDTKWHNQSVDQVMKALHLNSVEQGLSASEVEIRLKKYGKNELTEKKFTFPLWVRLLYRQTINLMSFVLLAAAIMSAVVQDYIDATVIFVIVVINIIIGFLQEYRSETTMQKLKNMTAPKCTVIRDGNSSMIASALIVPGDVVTLKEGDQVPADLRLTDCKYQHY